MWLIPAGLLLAAIAWVVTSARRIPSWLALALIVAAAWLTSIVANLVRGDKRELFVVGKPPSITPSESAAIGLAGYGPDRWCSL